MRRVLLRAVRESIAGLIKAEVGERTGLVWFGQHDVDWIAQVTTAVIDRTRLAIAVFENTAPAYLIPPEHGASGVAPGRWLVRRQQERGDGCPAPAGRGLGVHQPTATSSHCGLPWEMNEDWPATSSYGNPYARWLTAWSCQNLA